MILEMGGVTYKDFESCFDNYWNSKKKRTACHNESSYEISIDGPIPKKCSYYLEQILKTKE